MTDPTAELYEVPMPRELGAEPPRPLRAGGTGTGEAQLVGTAADLHEQADRIRLQVPLPPALARLVAADHQPTAQAEAEAIARVWDLELAKVAAICRNVSAEVVAGMRAQLSDLIADAELDLLHRAAPGLADRLAPGWLTSMDEPLTTPAPTDGPCPSVPGCTNTEPHSHKAWERLAARGDLTGEVAKAWSVPSWSAFLRAHDLTQVDAMHALREWAEARGEAAPSGLRSVQGRPDLAQVLLDLASGGRP